MTIFQILLDLNVRLSYEPNTKTIKYLIKAFFHLTFTVMLLP